MTIAFFAFKINLLHNKSEKKQKNKRKKEENRNN